DYVALLKHATKGRDLIRAYAYTGLDPENENQRKFIDFLAKNGYKPVVKDIRKFGDGRVKANLDIELVVDLFRLQDRMDVAVIVSGDGDFAPAIRALQDVGVRCEVISFRPNTSSDLIAVADEFFDIMKVASISRKRDEKAPVMPEMPAKESAPEFGFRDASPAVAAAALAALKSGNGSRSTRGGRPARRAPERPADEPEPELPTAAIAIDDGSASEAGEGRRRRRRRGGRGRGRGRGREAAAEEGAAAAPPEVGWQEFDDLSELEGLSEDREYTFEEADPETLAELGLLDAPASPPAPEEAPEPRSQGGAAPRPPSGESETAGAEAKPRRRRAASAKPTTTEEPAEQPKPRRRTRAAAGSEQEAPPVATKPRRRTRAAPKSEQPSPSSDGADEPEGIWQRFRSARENNPGS
ncbi:MAG: NYN domain-containing protein, partial [Chloroflexota bacterium]|nr:NYN domain-containing protein [Chloroflexota bacterium]